MTNNYDSGKPPSDANQHLPSQSEIPTTTPEQCKVGTESEKSASNQPTVAQEMRREFRWFEFATLFINVALVIVGIFALCIYSGQLTVMRGQLGEIIKQFPEIQKSANAAKSAAETANATLQDSKDSFHVQNRPYVVVTSNTGTAGFVRIQNLFDLSKVNITYGNIGKTPAYDVFAFSRFTIERFSKDDPSRTMNRAIEDAFKFISKDDVNITKYYGVLEKVDLPPGANQFITNELKNGPLTDTDKGALGQTPNTIILLCIGRIHYMAFDKTKSYSTDFLLLLFRGQPADLALLPHTQLGALGAVLSRREAE
jgi:hypothetical protein